MARGGWCLGCEGWGTGARGMGAGMPRGAGLRIHVVRMRRLGTGGTALALGPSHALSHFLSPPILASSASEREAILTARRGEDAVRKVEQASRDAAEAATGQAKADARIAEAATGAPGAAGSGFIPYFSE